MVTRSTADETILQSDRVPVYIGVNRFYFNKDKSVMVKPLIHFFTLEELQSHILLVDTGIIRRQAKIMQLQIGSTSNNLDNLLWLKEAVEVFEGHLRTVQKCIDAGFKI